MKASEILKAAAKDIDNAEIRAYENGEFVIMGHGCDGRFNGEDCAVLDKGHAFDFSRYEDETHLIQVDRDGSEYAIWRNGDFNNPFDREQFADRIEFYERFGN